MGAPEQHAFLPPSGADAWSQCAMWPTMNRLYPKPDTQDTMEGTASHWAFAEMLYWRPVAVGQVAPNGVTLNDEMIEAAELFVYEIDEALREYGLDRSHLHVEQRVYMPHIHQENWGTPDVWFYVPHLGLLVVFDYKFGHKFVDAYQNWQLMDYASGILNSMGINGIHDQHMRVSIRVVQPRNYDRAGPLRTWDCMASDLRPFINILHNQAALAMRQEPPSKVGDHCEHCPGRHACNPLQRSAYRAVWLSKQSTPHELPPDALALELRTLEDALANLKARHSGLYEEAQNRAKLKGERFPGWMLEPTFSREGWKVPDEQVIQAGKTFGKNLAKVKAVTPKQALAAGLEPSIVAAWKEQKQTGVKLVIDDGSAASKVFGKRN